MMDAWATGKLGFTPTFRSRKIFNDENPRELLTVRLASEDEAVQAGQSQMLLSFQGVIKAPYPERTSNILNEISPKHPDPRIIEAYYRSCRSQLLRINTAELRRDEHDKIDITPYAGIQFNWRKGAQHAYAKGLSFIEGKPHTTDNLGIRVPLSDFAQIQSRIHKLSGSSKRI